MCSMFFPTFSSIRFSVSSIMWRSLIHLNLRIVKGDENGSICILLHVDCQLIQHHLLKMLFFFTGWFQLLCQRSSDISCEGSFLGPFIGLFFSRQGFSVQVQPWLSQNSLCRPGMPRTQKSACLCLPSAGIKGVQQHCPVISGSSILFKLFFCLSLYQYHSVFFKSLLLCSITGILTSGMVIPPEVLLLLRIIFTILFFVLFFSGFFFCCCCCCYFR